MTADGADWRRARAQVPGAQAPTGVEVTPLTGGTSNSTFRVVTRDGAFVVRLHDPLGTDLGVDRRREALLQSVAASAGLAGRVIAADPAGRYLVSEFLDGAPWQPGDLEDRTRLRQLGERFGQLHSLAAPVVTPLDLEALLERHAAHIAALEPAAGRLFAPQVVSAREILKRQADAGRAPCILHGDPTHSNFIGTPPRFIDWEYATVGDPLADLACLLAYYPQILPHARILLDSCGLAARVPLSALQALVSVYRLASDLWWRRLELARRHPPPAH
ncbi:MAG TPA: choline/ethanolamine kinase family protein [Steroidobacteraceae bacterium]|nr:choline/ethanolamine kinase family protein [Steroidobacteraceae bacterium]